MPCVSQDPETTKDPVEFVQRLLNEKDKYDAVIARSFGMDKSFQNSLNQAFEHFLNLNQRSPEFISLFMDDKLRKGLKARAPAWDSIVCPDALAWHASSALQTFARHAEHCQLLWLAADHGKWLFRKLLYACNS